MIFSFFVLNLFSLHIKGMYYVKFSDIMKLIPILKTRENLQNKINTIKYIKSNSYYV